MSRLPTGKINQTSRDRGILSSKTPHFDDELFPTSSYLLLYCITCSQRSWVNQIFCLSHHFVFLYLKNASRHNVPKSKLGKQGSNLINTTNYITIRYEEPIFFLIVIIWVLVVVSEDLIQNTILSNYFISPLENQESGLHVRKSISLQRSESMDLDLLRLF